MVITVTFGGDPISKSPFAVGVAAPLDLSRIKVDGLESSEFSYWHTHVALWRLINYLLLLLWCLLYRVLRSVM